MKKEFNLNNLSWIVDYDYERTPCHCKADICRCTSIYDAHVSNVNVDHVIDHLFRLYPITDTPINRYCFDRICRSHKIYDPDLYDVEYGYGYYGDEIYGVYFREEQTLFADAQKLESFENDLDKILFCLELEYGYLIDAVKHTSDCKVLSLNPNNIIIPNNEYYRKLEKETVDMYRDLVLPIGVCVGDANTGWCLVDGYHRYMANKDREMIDIVWLTK